MTAYEQELKRCKVVLFLRAVIEAGGNQCRAAEKLGVGRNTINRVLHGAGYDMESLKRLARTQRKPVASVTAIGADRRTA
jgi:DNA-binding NtrC family response regulator